MVAGCEGGEDGDCGRSGCCNVEQPLCPARKRESRARIFKRFEIDSKESIPQPM